MYRNQHHRAHISPGPNSPSEWRTDDARMELTTTTGPPILYLTNRVMFHQSSCWYICAARLAVAVQFS